MTDPICFDCKHFKQYQPLEFMIPVECLWSDKVPAWLEGYVDPGYRDYYAPKRDVYSGRGYAGPIITQCATFKSK